MAVIWGVDVHPQYQQGISFASLAREGYTFAVVKATEGIGFTAPGWDAMVRAARAAGLLAGAYHYLLAGDGAAQCRYFLDRLAVVGGPAGMLIQLDVESDGREQEIRSWLREWVRRGHGHHPVLIYSGAWWWQPNVGSFAPARLPPAEAPRTHLWHSRYVSGSGPASALYAGVADGWWRPGYGGWDTATILQFSSKGTAGGVTANVDVNAYRGSLEQLRALAPAAAGPGADPEGTAMAGAEEIIVAWSQGMPKTVSGKSVEPVSWRIRDEQWQAKVDDALAAVRARVEQLAADPVQVVLDADDRAGIAAAVIAAIAPQLQAAADTAAEAAIRRVLGSLDGATPPPAGPAGPG